MKRQFFSLIICLFLFMSLFSGFLNFVDAPAGDGIVEIDVNSQGTYLRVVNWHPQWGPGPSDLTPTVVDLAANGLNPGDVMVISYSGNWSFNAGWELPEHTSYAEAENVKLLGLFSASSSISAMKNLDRVSGAIDYGEDYVTPNTWWEETLQKRNDDGTYEPPLKGGNQPTDIPEDFRITPHTGMEIEIPNNAKFLMFAFHSRYPPTSRGNIKVTLELDSDRDGLPDSWEMNGIYIDDDDIVDLDLPALGARWDRKDIFVEIDYMGASGGHDHRPNIDAINDVIDAFDKAPVNNPGPSGINLHVIEFIDQVIPHQNEIAVWSDFDKIKKTFFGTEADQNSPNKENIFAAKKMVFHYCLFVHDRKGTKYSGKGELPGNDFIISLGTFTGSTGNRGEQAGTFMHELGHNLGLRHGGADNIHYKPNYLSVMNYLFQIPSLTSNLFSRPLDYSRMQMDDLDENSLNENGGVGIANWVVTVYSGKLQTATEIKYVPIAVSTLSKIDWNNNGDETESNVAANINNFPQRNYNSPTGENLTGHNDWVNLVFRFRGYPSFADGVHPTDTDEELTFEIAEKIRESMQDLDVVYSTPILLDSDDTTEDSQFPLETLSLIIIVSIAIIILLFIFYKRRQKDA